MSLRALAVGLLWLVAVAFLPSTAWATTEPTTPPAEPTSSGEPAPSSSPSPEATPAPAETVTVTETATPAPAAPAPGEKTGVYVDPTTGAVVMGEKSGVALGVAAWLAAVVAGLSTAWLVLP